MDTKMAKVRLKVFLYTTMMQSNAPLTYVAKLTPLMQNGCISPFKMLKCRRIINLLPQPGRLLNKKLLKNLLTK